jgi:hypothetical protein
MKEAGVAEEMVHLLIDIGRCGRLKPARQFR